MIVDGRIDKAKLFDLGVGLTWQDGVNSPTGCIGLEGSVVELGFLGCTRSDPSAELDVAILSTDGEETSSGSGKARGDGESGDGGRRPVDETDTMDGERSIDLLLVLYGSHCGRKGEKQGPWEDSLAKVTSIREYADADGVQDRRGGRGLQLSQILLKSKKKKQEAAVRVSELCGVFARVLCREKVEKKKSAGIARDDGQGKLLNSSKFTC